LIGFDHFSVTKFSLVRLFLFRSLVMDLEQDVNVM